MASLTSQQRDGKLWLPSLKRPGRYAIFPFLSRRSHVGKLKFRAQVFRVLPTLTLCLSSLETAADCQGII